MASFLDIVPNTRSVTLRGVKYDVPGIPLQNIARLLLRFPSVLAKFSGQELSTARLMQECPDMIAPVIAAGMGYFGNEKAEAVAAALPPGDQLDALAEIVEATAPEGLNPLLEKAVALAVRAGMAEAAAGPPLSEGFKVRSTNRSAKPSKDSSSPATASMM